MADTDGLGFLPVCPEDLKKRGIAQLDFVYVTGDAYVDHPSFGTAIISRVLQSRGFQVGIIAQPDWKDPESIACLGTPRLGFLVSAGNMDSMVNHYTVSRKHRQKDMYSPGGRMGLRPDRAVLVYSNLIRRHFPDAAIIAGGIEASLRRLAHYDYWSDRMRRSVLMDCGADLISYGMGERSIIEIAQALDAGIQVRDITWIPGTCFRTKSPSLAPDAVVLPAWEELMSSGEAYARSFYKQYTNTDPFNGHQLAEWYDTVCVVQNPPAKPLSMEEMDEVYALPYQRTWHPMYEAQGGIPAIAEVKFSLVSNRGCFGGCSFCALTFHQGRIVQVRSHDSILEEAVRMTEDKDFKGYIHDVGGPTANFRGPSCRKQLVRGVCKNRQCLFPKPCPNLEVDHSDYVALLRKLRALPKVKKVFVRSGIRYDYVCADPSDEFLRELVKHHISGQLKVAPEHVSPPVLEKLGKPDFSVYRRFVRMYEQMNRDCGMDQYLVPYLMSSHPGCTMKDAVKVAEYLREIHHMPEQVQDFYPTPSTLSTCMYYTGLDPRTMEPVYVPKDPHEKAMQRALLQYALPANRSLVTEALHIAHREDLIGYGPKCLIHPEKDPLHAAAAAGRSGRGKNTEDAGRTAVKGREKAGRGRSTEQPGRGRSVEQPGRGRSAEQPGRGRSAEQTGRGRSAEQPGRGRSAEQPGRSRSAEYPGRGAGTETSGRSRRLSGRDTEKTGRGTDTQEPSGRDAGRSSRGSRHGVIRNVHKKKKQG